MIDLESSNVEQKEVLVPDQVSSSSSELSACAHSSNGQTIFKVVPVRVWVDDSSRAINTYAFIDEGSSVSLCATSLANRLGLTPKNADNVELVTINAVTTITKKLDPVFIKGMSETAVFLVQEALIVDNVVNVSSSIPTAV